MRRPHRFSRLGLVLTVALAVGSASCAESADVIAPSAARQLRTQMDGIRAAIDSGDRTSARQAIRALEREALRLRDEGLIDPARADVILASAREVAIQLSLLPALSSSPTTTLSPSPSPESGEDYSDDEKEDEEKDKEKDQGKEPGHSEDD